MPGGIVMREAPTLLATKPPQDASSPHILIEPSFGMIDPDGSTDIVGKERFDTEAQGAIASGQYTWPSGKGYPNITAVALNLQHRSRPELVTSARYGPRNNRPTTQYE